MTSEVADHYRGVRVLVLGAGGFIGRTVACRLKNTGADLFIAVRNAGLMSSEFSAVNVVEIDLLDFAAIPDVIRDIAPCIVFNLAGYGVDRSERDENISWRLNAKLPPLLVDVIDSIRASRWEWQRIVHVGSALEYGESNGDLSETTIAQPTTLYGRSKLAGTHALKQRSEALGIPNLTARLFTVYGPGEHPGRLLPALLETARMGASLELTAGVQQRDFSYVDDVSEGLLRLGVARTLPGEIVNLATGRLTSVRHFAETAARILEIPPDRLHFGRLPTRGEEMAHAPVSITRLKEVTSWVPSTSIEEGIKRTMQTVSGIDSGIV